MGIVGLPGSGATTIFTALTQIEGAAAGRAAQAAVPVPDPRVDVLADLHKSRKRTYSQLRFVEVSGRVRRGARGTGALSAELLGHLRECDAVLLVVKAFDGAVEDPADLMLELALADADVVAGKLERTRKEAMLTGDAKLRGLVPLLERMKEVLDAGTQLHDVPWTADERAAVADLSLITLKPGLLVANVGEEAPSALPPDALPVAGRLEVEVAGMAPGEAAELLASFGQAERGIDRVVRAVYDRLGLITFLTAGPTESRAWEIAAGSTAPQAAGAVHSDMERGFIRAEVCAYEDVVRVGGWPQAKGSGLVRQEGKGYVVNEGDVVEFRFAV